MTRGRSDRGGGYGSGGGGRSYGGGFGDSDRGGYGDRGSDRGGDRGSYDRRDQGPARGYSNFGSRPRRDSDRKSVTDEFREPNPGTNRMLETLIAREKNRCVLSRFKMRSSV